MLFSRLLLWNLELLICHLIFDLLTEKWTAAPKWTFWSVPSSPSIIEREGELTAVSTYSKNHWPACKVIPVILDQWHSQATDSFRIPWTIDGAHNVHTFIIALPSKRTALDHRAAAGAAEPDEKEAVDDSHRKGGRRRIVHFLDDFLMMILKYEMNKHYL